MAQQQDGRRPSGGEPYVPARTRQTGLTRQQRQARSRRQREQALRRRRRRMGFAFGILFLLLLIGGAFLIWSIHGASGIPEDELDELDMDELDDEAEEALYNGPPVATIAFVGDISVSADQVKAVTGADGNYDFPSVFEDIKDYLSADAVAYAVGDFETTMVDGMPFGREPYYNAPIELAGTLRGLGFRLMSTANTYALNNGIEGVNSTKNYLSAAKLRSVGTYMSQAERDENGGAYIRNIHKIKFAFLSYTKGTDSVTMPEGCEYALNTLYSDYADYWSDLRTGQIRRDLQAARDAGAEVIVVLVHWGSEYSRTVSDPQKELAELLLDYGADVIIGTHSHLVSKMGFEKVTRSDGSAKQCFVAYSLGDFYTDPEQPEALQSLILNLEFSREDDGRVVISNASYVPVYNLITEENGVRQFHIIDVYRNMAELKRVDMNSTQATLFNELLDTVDTMHNYGGEELDAGPSERDRRIISKALAEGPVSSGDILAMQRAEEAAAEKAAEEAARQKAEAAEQDGEAEEG